MTHEEFISVLAQEVQRHAMTERQMLDLLAQKAHFDALRRLIERQHRNKVVGFVGGKMHVETTLQKLLRHGRRGKLVYFEPVGFSLI
jgi:hypothetical protein